MKKTIIVVGVVCILLAIVLAFLWITSETPASEDFGVVVGENQSSSRTFSPFGTLIDLFTGGSENQTEQGTTTPENARTNSVYDLVSVTGTYKVTEEPVATAGFFSTGTSTESVLRYIERETGHVYEVGLESGNIRRLSNTTVPRIQNAEFGNNGTIVALQYLGEDTHTIETFVGNINTSTSTFSQELNGEFLSQNIQSIALHPSTPGVFYTLRAGSGVVGRLYDPVSRQIAPLFSSALSEWNATWNSSSSLILNTKPSSTARGFAYLVDLSNASTERVFSGVFGLTTLPNSLGSRILVGSSNEWFRLFVSSSTGDLSPITLGDTLPEKCVWVDDTTLICAIPSEPSSIDAWYEGSVSFNDSVWKINTTTNLTDFLFNEEHLGEQFDATHLSISPDGLLLSFINKKDSRLWVASLSQEEFGTLPSLF